MNTDLAYVIHHAVTSPQFRAHLLNRYEALVVEHGLQLSQEDRQVLQDVLVYIDRPSTEGQGLDTETAAQMGWDGGPSFTAVAV